MKSDKSVIFVLPVMHGGGAERVAAELANQFADNGCAVSIILTSTSRDEVVANNLKDDVPVIILRERFDKSTLRRCVDSLLRVVSTALCKPLELLGRAVPAPLAYLSFRSHYRREVYALRSIMRAHPDATFVAFLQPAIPILLLAARGLPNRVIFSERSDPNRLMKKRYGKRFIERYYPRADAVVFQTETAKSVYPECVSKRGTVISNPIMPGLPEPYTGNRNCTITTFCRISKVKNLPMLFEAFASLHREHAEYILRVIGDTLNEEGRAVKERLTEYIKEQGLTESVLFEPFTTQVHAAILQDAMYVNSSDYEGISNAMLEAMAIGLPVICTDCPIGGARQTIQDEENGLIVPVGDAQALYRAMKRVIEEPGLAEKLSENAQKLRTELALDTIADKWMELL